MIRLKSTSSRIVVFFIVFFLFLALYNYRFFTHDRRLAVDHDTFYTDIVVSTLNYSESHPFSESLYKILFSSGRLNRPQLANAYLFVVLKIFPANMLTFKMANLLFLWLIVLAAFLWGRELKDEEVGVVAAVVVGTLPMFIDGSHKWIFHYQTFGLCAIGLLYAMRVRKSPAAAPYTWYILSGVAFGLALMIHPMALPYLILAALALVLSLFRSTNRGKVALGIGLMMLALLLIAGYWYGRFFAMYWQDRLGYLGQPDQLVPAQTVTSLPLLLRDYLLGRVSDTAGMFPLPHLLLFGLPLLALPLLLIKDGFSRQNRFFLETLVICLVLFVASFWTKANRGQFFDWFAFYIMLAPLGLAMFKQATVTDEPEQTSSKKRFLFLVPAALWAILAVLCLLQCFVVSYKKPDAEIDSWANSLFFNSRQQRVREMNNSMLHFQLEPECSLLMVDALTDRFGENEKIKLHYRKLARGADGKWAWVEISLEELYTRRCNFSGLIHELYFRGLHLPQHQLYHELDLDWGDEQDYQPVYLVNIQVDNINRPMRELLGEPIRMIIQNYPEYQIKNIFPANRTQSVNAVYIVLLTRR